MDTNQLREEIKKIKEGQGNINKALNDLAKRYSEESNMVLSLAKHEIGVQYAKITNET